jgi:hypothetical protein
MLVSNTVKHFKYERKETAANVLCRMEQKKNQFKWN